MGEGVIINEGYLEYRGIKYTTHPDIHGSPNYMLRNKK